MAVLAAFVGPSGAGKDTLMEAVHTAQPDSHIVRRVITRPASAGGEVFEGVTTEVFMRRARAGDFALHWQAHDLHYGIPAQVDEELDAGTLCLVNLSRNVLGQAARRFPSLHVFNITASPEVLAERLAKRGRESKDQILRRLSRKPDRFPPDLKLTEIVNEGPVSKAVRQVLAALHPAKA
ncbi:MAG: phosphonate metabolism protein/1,5-bisphosphokinase (PRPP-forming) PhnN [Pseudomonadota bacterium]